MLSQWLGLMEPTSSWINPNDTQFQDPYEEFFILDTKNTTNMRSWSVNNVSSAEDIEDLAHRYQLREEITLPYFIDKHLATFILRAGNARRLLRRCQPNHPLNYVYRWLSTDGRTGLQLRWLLTDLQRNSYDETFRSFCSAVRAFNSGNTTYNISECNRLADDVPLDRASPTRDSKMEEAQIVPSLAPLKDIDLSREFSKTLRCVMRHHQSLSESPQENSDVNYFIPVLDIVTFESIRKPLLLWYPLVSGSAMKLFIHKFSIRDHLMMLYRYFLLGEGTFVSGIVNTLLASGEDPKAPERAGLRLRLQSRVAWPPRTSELNLPLQALLLETMGQISEKERLRILKSIQGHMVSEQLEDLITFSVRDINEHSEWKRPEAVGALDFLCLSYRTQYPLNVIITPSALKKYNSAFTFLLQVIRISSIPKQLYHRFHSRSQPSSWYSETTLNVLHQFRFQIDKFTSAFEAYIFDTAVRSTWTKFIARIGEMEQDEDGSELTMMDPVAFSKYHEDIIDRILFRCFLKKNQQLIMAALRQIFDDIIQFMILLDDYKILRRSQQQEMELLRRCQRLFEKFKKHTKLFADILKKLLREGTVHVGNLMGSLHETSYDPSIDVYERTEFRRSSLEDLIKDLLARLSINGFYGTEDGYEVMKAAYGTMAKS
ncbi:hypothetical protein EC973_009209 [Apophysomyces ossiformis]|uniref:Spindle pole body component n=1 Tax=Apophysomyces ossiformis TaxID=679940 RepID=A0A8H7BSL8_9FUNG|nr:hypothetical protein EC973_009209 [Apophysomyces ossiformis]